METFEKLVAWLKSNAAIFSFSSILTFFMLLGKLCRGLLLLMDYFSS